MSPQKSNRWLHIYIPSAILMAGFLIRYFFIFEWHRPELFVFSDMEIYLRWAKQIVNGTITLDHFFQPIGLPLIEAAILKFGDGTLSALSWFQLTLSLATLVFLWKTTERLSNPYLALIALALASFHYPFIFLTGVYLSECLFAFILSLIAWLLSLKPHPWSHRWAYFLGLTLGLSLWVKGTFIFFLPIFILWLLIQNKWKFNLSAFKPGIFLTTGFLTVMLAHGIFSYTATNKFLLSPTNGGLNFMEGKCPWKKNIGPDGYWWFSPLYTQIEEKETRKWSEPFNNSSYYFQQGLHCIAEDPMVLVRSFQSIPYLFINNDFWPSLNTNWDYKDLSRNYSLFFALWSLPALFISMLLIFKTKSTEKILSWTFPVLTIFLTVWFFKSELRFRIPFDVIIIPMGVWGWDQILKMIFPEWSNLRRYKIQTAIVSIVIILVSSSLIWPR